MGQRQAPSDYYESNIASRVWRRNLAAMVLKLMKPGWEKETVLDVGVGDGYTIRLVKPHGPVVGIDADVSMSEAATSRGISFRPGSAYDIPFPDSTFGLVTCIEVVEHLARPSDALAELARVLTPGGSIIVTTPVPSLLWKGIWWAWSTAGPGRRWETTPHVSDLHIVGHDGGKNSLTSMLRSLGFSVAKVETCNFGMVSGLRAEKGLLHA